MSKIVKLRLVGDSLVTTIPKQIVDGLNWQEGDKLELEISKNNTVNLKKVIRSEEK